jgi:hypothetical protein
MSFLQILLCILTLYLCIVVPLLKGHTSYMAIHIKGHTSYMAIHIKGHISYKITPTKGHPSYQTRFQMH